MSPPGRRALTTSRPSPAIEVALTAPLFAIYQLGLLFLDVRNGADWLTGLVTSLLDASVIGYVAFVLAATAALTIYARRSTRDPDGTIRRLLAESTLLAIVLVLVVGTTSRLLSSTFRIPVDSWPGSIIVSAGAGFHEELFFRVILFGGGATALVALGWARRRALVASAVVSSVLFALAHHVGPLGEPLALAPLGMRFVSGLYFAAVFRFRGFATAVYTHALYDVIVLLLLR